MMMPGLWSLLEAWLDPTRALGCRGLRPEEPLRGLPRARLAMFVAPVKDLGPPHARLGMPAL